MAISHYSSHYSRHFSAFLSPLAIQLKNINRKPCDHKTFVHITPYPHRSHSSHSIPTCTVEPLSSTTTPLQQFRHSGNFLRTHWAAAFSQTSTSVCPPIAIDATAGRGSDTITLGQYAGINGTVHAFDIQASALEETKQRYTESNAKATLHLHQQSHADFSCLHLASKSVACITYNLGWYPGMGADRSIITKVKSTISSLKFAEEIIAVGGLISVMGYVGHIEGEEECDAVEEWTKSLCKEEWLVGCFEYPNRANAPRMFLAEKLC